ncbi:unnamed protein product [Paramecium primaurelia]|uniref:Transmembrane protein n=1 Tax=Paramecium primaurelia TaxID=5886 RepID=A0A8S1JS08_PARPR|nr:unnamed protein product [Paramecium primaurelia]
MIRTDSLVNKTNCLSIFLMICIFVALNPPQKTIDNNSLEIFEVEVNEFEINYFLDYDIVYNDTDQFGLETVQNWLPIQSELAQLNLALDYFSRLNLDKLIKQHNEFQIQVDKCLQLSLNQDLENFLNKFNSTINNDSQIADYMNNLLNRRNQLHEFYMEKKNDLENLNNEERMLKSLIIEYQINEQDSTILNKKIFNLNKLKQMIEQSNEEQINLIEKIKYQKSLGEEEDLSEYYRKDQDQAKKLRQLFKPAGTKQVEIHNEKLYDLVNVLDQNIKQYSSPTEVYFNGLNFSPELRKNALEELQLQYTRLQIKLEQQLKNQEDLEREIDELERKKKAKEKRYADVLSKLEMVRNVQKNLEKDYDIVKLQIEEITKEIKNIMPINNIENNQRLNVQQQYKQYIYEHLDQDQKCVEKCVQYDSLNQQFYMGRYKQSLYLIQRHFQELDKLFNEFKI